MNPTVLLAIGAKSGIPDTHSNYIRAIEEAGGAPEYLRPGADLREMDFDGLLIMGGPELDPNIYGQQNISCETLLPQDSLSTLADAFDIAMERALPILGICMGMQFINVKYGGTLIQDMESPHRDGKSDVNIVVKLSEQSLLSDIFSEDEFDVCCHHHQCVDQIGNGLRAIAHATDGTIEAVCSDSHPFLIGVEWHPERTNSQESDALFRTFVDACSNRRG